MRHGKRGLLVAAMAYGLALAAVPAGVPGLADRDSRDEHGAGVAPSLGAATLQAERPGSAGTGQPRLLLAGGTGVGNPGTTKSSTRTGSPGTTRGK